MEVFGPHNTSACLDAKSRGGSSTDTNHPTKHNLEDLSMNDLNTCLTKYCNVEDIGLSNKEIKPSPGKDYVVDVLQECECQGLEQIRTCNSASEKCLSKFASFPPLNGPKYSVNAIVAEKEKQVEEINAEVSEVNGSNRPSNKCYSRSISLPVALKLVPAIKGSREKHGAPPKNLSVTWSPDVYDPVPTSVSHAPSNKNQNYRSNNRKYGKYKQKSSSKSSRSSSKSKDKKQVRRSGSSGSSKLKPFYQSVGSSFDEPEEEDTVDFDVGTPDPFCGSSFLNQSVRNMHFSVAEAT